MAIPASSPWPTIWCSDPVTMRRAVALLLMLPPLGVAAAQSEGERLAPLDLVVVTHNASAVGKLSRNEVINIFFGRNRQLPSGLPAIPFDQPPDSQEKKVFYMKLVSKEPSEINAYWARLIFSGRTQPPRQAESATEMAALISSHRGAIGYIERSKLDPRLKVVYELGL